MNSVLIFRSLEEAIARSTPSALAIGNFDGVHLGHQSLLRNTTEVASTHACAAAALTFDPHPTTIVAPERVPQKLCTLDERLHLLADRGTQQITVLPFTADIARLSPEAFVREILVGALKVKAVLVGENFRFGFQQTGDAAALVEIGKLTGFEACLLPPVFCRGEVVSSSAIRRYLLGQNVARANRLLGRCFSLEGPVVSGHGVGSKQTVPTLNLRPLPGLLTPPGVFVTSTSDLATARTWQSITNVGTRPTFRGDEVTIETFLLSPFEEPTPQHIRIDFRRFIRPERAFSDPQALRTQIMRDVTRAQAYWRRAQRLSRAAPSIY